MATIDDTPESLPPTPKKRRTTHWKAVAKVEQEIAEGRQKRLVEALGQLQEARASAATWKTTNTLNYRLFKAAVGVALAEFIVILFLVFR